jgi:hypothetical protein
MKSFEREWIEEIQRTYLPYKYNGSRYTGAGEDGQVQKGRVAGVVHEGEQVIENEMVDDAGGPARIRQEVERLAAENSKLPGYQEGTGSTTAQRLPSLPNIPVEDNQIISQGAKDSLGPISMPEEKTPSETFTRLTLPTPTVIDHDRPSETSTQLELPAPVVKQPSETFTELKLPTPTVVDHDREPKPDVTVADTTTEEDIGRVRDIATGQSEAARIAREREMSELSAKHEAERQSLNQQLAQQGADQEEINSAMAQLGTKQRSESEQARTGLAQAEAERAEAAAVTTAQLQMSKEDMDSRQKYQNELLKMDWERLAIDKDYAAQQKIQFNEMLKLDWAQFNLSDEQFRDISARAWKQIETQAEQFGMDYALRSLAVNAEIQMPLMNAALQSGDFASATAIANKFGVNLDLSKAENAFQQQEIGQGLANLIFDISNIPEAISMDPAELINNRFLKDDLERMWTNMNPGEEAKGPAYEKWAKETVRNAALSQDQYYVFANQLTDDSVKGLASTLGWGDDFTFNGTGGIDGMRLGLTAFLAGGGVTYDEATGGLVFDPNAFDKIDSDENIEFGTTTTTTTTGGNVGGTTTQGAQTNVVNTPQDVITPDEPGRVNTETLGTSTAPEQPTENPRMVYDWIYNNFPNISDYDLLDIEDTVEIANNMVKNDIGWNNVKDENIVPAKESIKTFLQNLYPNATRRQLENATSISNAGKISNGGMQLLVFAKLFEAGLSANQAYRAGVHLLGSSLINEILEYHFNELPPY